MIDTVILTVPKSKAILLDLTGRGVPPWDLQKRGKGFEKYVKNASKKDEESGLYFPRLAEIRRQKETNIKIEFSAPKLLYQNNLEELRDSDFERVVDILDDRLKQMGVAFPIDALRNAAVRSVHYSKNIELTGGYTSQYVIRELGKINVNKRFDLTRAKYTNDGESMCIYTIAHSFVIYDKIADLAKDKKRAIDQDQTPYQTSLFKELKREKEILRLEVRLSQKRKMDAVFKELGFATDPTFRDVFSTKKSKKVVNHYWEKMIEGQSIHLFTHSLTPKGLLGQILLARKGAKGKTAVYLTGLLLLARDENGVRELRSMLGKKSDDRTWYRIAKDLRQIAADLEKTQPREWYEQVKTALSTYQLVQVACK